MDIKLVNVLLLGFGFMLVFTAFQTCVNIQKVVLNSIHKDDPDFMGDGYISLAIVYALFAICNWLAPSTLMISGPRAAMVIGSATYGLFMVSFLWPQTWFLYTTSALMGAGAALTWAGQGLYITKCSDPTTITRNSGVFWALWQASMFFGNMFVYYQFQGETHIAEKSRQVVFSGLIGVAVLGLVCLALLKNTKEFEITTNPDREGVQRSLLTSVVGEFKSAVKLFCTRDILLLSLTFLYVGIVTSFFNVYSSSIGFTLAFGDSAKQLVGLSGICIGIGEIIGGVTFGLLGKKTIRFGRQPIVIVGFLVHVLAFAITLVNFPANASLGESEDPVYLDRPSSLLAVIGSLLLGLGDAIFNTQIYSMLGGDFASQSAVGFALFRFFLSVGAATSFVYSSYCGLRTHVVVLVVMGVLATTGFSIVERRMKRRKEEDDD